MLHPVPKACYSFPFHVLCSQVAQAFVPSSSANNHEIVPGIQYKDEKTVAIPENLILQHEGNKYLKFRPTAQPIISLLLGHGPRRNASCSQHEPLTQLIEARNAKIKKLQTETPEDDPSQNLFDQENDEPPAKKKRCTVSAPFVVTITACDKAVGCLVSSQRPTRSDLAILMEPSHLEPVLCHLRPGIGTALQMPTKAHKATK